MSRFELLMDDIRDAIELIKDNKKILVMPIVGGYATMLFSVITIVAFVFITVFGIIGTVAVTASFNPLLLIGIIISIFVIAILIGAVSLIFEIGIIGLVKELMDGNPYHFDHFKNALQQYYLRGLGTSIGMSFIVGLIFLILLIPLAIYLLTVGVLSGGWGMVLLSLWVQSLIGFWQVLMIENGAGGFASVGENLRFGSKNLKILILIFFIGSMLSTNAMLYFGWAGAIASIGFAGIVNTHIKVVIIKSYRRYSKAF